MELHRTVPVQETIAKHETLLTLFVYFGSYPLLYAVNVMLSRALGPANYGDYAVTRSVATLAATIAMLGLNKATLNFLPVYRERGAQDAAKGFIFLSLVAILLAGATLSLIGAGVTELLLRQLASEPHPVRIAMIWVIPMSIGLHGISLLCGHQRVFLSSLLDRVMLPVITAMLLGGVFLAGRTLTDFAAVGLLVVARVLLTLIVVWLLWSIWRREYREVAPTFQLKQWAGATLPFLLTALVIAALGQSSTLILEAHHPSENEVGIYAAVQQVAYLPLLALGAIGTLARPRLATLLEDGESTQFEQELGAYTVSVGVIYAVQLWLLQRKTGIPYVLSMLPRSTRSSARDWPQPDPSPIGAMHPLILPIHLASGGKGGELPVDQDALGIALGNCSQDFCSQLIDGQNAPIELMSQSVV